MQTPTQPVARPLIHLPSRTAGVTANASEEVTCPDRLPLRRFASHSLLGESKVVEIRHNDAVYRLSATRQGKLILTK